MERIGFLINKLREQYEKADSQTNMLVTLQMLYRELMPKMDGNLAIGKISVMIPGQMDMTFLEKSIEQKHSLDLTSNSEGKQVFELSVEPSEDIKLVEQQAVAEIKPMEKILAVQPEKMEQTSFIQPQPIEKPIVAVVEAPKNPFVKVVPKVEIPAVNTEPVLVEKPIYEQPEIIKPKVLDESNARYMPQEFKPAIKADPIVEASQPSLVITPQPSFPPKITATVVPPREVHETLQPETQPSLNDKVEKRQPELFHVLKAEPLKDLKKAININERFQYINHLFMKDETMYERSLKTINNFNVFSEAHFWIRKELATKLGWDDNDELVQQFMNLVERRFL